jgi:2-polyprenyl-6-methoxyphenol hydroxylase-like FAD-dependent oxidoreductase
MSRIYDVAIAGCGIAGLAAGTFLARAGHQVTAFDRVATPAPVGSGLILQPVGLEVLSALGLEGATTDLGARIERLFGRVVPSRRIVLDVRYGALKRPGFGLAVHRAALFHVLYEAARSAGVGFETGREITASQPTAGGGRTLRFGDGSASSRFDLVLDALGAWSALSPKPARALAFGALWANVPWPADAGFDSHALEQRYVGAHKMIGVLPIGRLPGAAARQAALFWSLKGEDEPRWRAAPFDAWKHDVTAIWPEVSPLLAHLNLHEDLVFARYAHRTVDRPIEPGLAHIGDSYHCASPQLGQGANMALIDAMALAYTLERAPDLTAALTAYARLRRWHVRIYQLASRLFTPAYQSDSSWLPFVRDRLAGPLSRTGPFPRVLAALVAGRIGWSFSGLTSIVNVQTEAPGGPSAEPLAAVDDMPR